MSDSSARTPRIHFDYRWLPLVAELPGAAHRRLTRPGSPHDDLDMAHYHDELVRAGVLLAGDLAAGFWLLEVDSRAEAAEWGRRMPRGDVEIREVAESR